MGFSRRSALVDATRTGVAARRDRARRRRRRPLRAVSRANPELPDAPPSLRARTPDRAPRFRSSLTDPPFSPSPLPPSQLAAPALAIPAGWRLYGAGYLDKAEVTDRVVSVVKNFNKVDPAKVSPTSSFGADLGLDSLDTVEVVMAVEEEFAVEIPDAEADKITSVGEAVEYLVTNPNAR
jgi:NADH dehydrogenase (ubiquinone) 1 alpha/beta subcomplex 1